MKSITRSFDRPPLHYKTCVRSLLSLLSLIRPSATIFFLVGSSKPKGLLQTSKRFGRIKAENNGAHKTNRT